MTTVAWALPSWVAEVAAGLALIGVFRLAETLGSWYAAALAAATAISTGYELFVDVHGWSWLDWSTRETGIMLGLTIVYIWEWRRKR